MTSRYLALVAASIVLAAASVPAARAAEDQEQGEQKIAFKEAPSAVRKTLDREANGQTIKSVDKEQMKGKTVYEADVIIDKHKYEIVVDQDGLLLSKKLDNEEDEKAEKSEANEGKSHGKNAKDKDEEHEDKQK